MRASRLQENIITFTDRSAGRQSIAAFTSENSPKKLTRDTYAPSLNEAIKIDHEPALHPNV